MNSYILKHYDLRQKLDVIIEVSGESARDVVLAHWRAMFPLASQPASLTARHQRDPNSAVRDNAHLQADRAGYVGWVAERMDAETRTAELDAMTADEYHAYLATCPSPAGNSALVAAGYSAS